VNDKLGDCGRSGRKPFLWHCLLRLRRGLRRSRLHFGQRLFTAFCADGARCVFGLFRRVPVLPAHALRAASAVAALTTLAAFSTFTAPAASAPAPAASGFTRPQGVVHPVGLDSAPGCASPWGAAVVARGSRGSRVRAVGARRARA